MSKEKIQPEAITEETVAPTQDSQDVENTQTEETPFDRMSFEAKIVLTGNNGETVNIDIKGIDEDGGLNIETDLPQEFDGNNQFHKQLAGVILNVFSAMRVMRKTPAEIAEAMEEEAMTKAMAEAEEENPKQVFTLGQRGEA